MEQDLYNDMVERPLVVSLRDAAAENAPIGTGEISLVPLLHDATEVWPGRGRWSLGFVSRWAGICRDIFTAKHHNHRVVK